MYGYADFCCAPWTSSTAYKTPYRYSISLLTRDYCTWVESIHGLRLAALDRIESSNIKIVHSITVTGIRSRLSVNKVEADELGMRDGMKIHK